MVEKNKNGRRKGLLCVSLCVVVLQSERAHNPKNLLIFHAQNTLHNTPNTENNTFFFSLSLHRSTRSRAKARHTQPTLVPLILIFFFFFSFP